MQKKIGLDRFNTYGRKSTECICRRHEESDGAGEHWVQSDGCLADGRESSWETTWTELLVFRPMQKEVMGLG